MTLGGVSGIVWHTAPDGDDVACGLCRAHVLVRSRHPGIKKGGTREGCRHRVLLSRAGLPAATAAVTTTVATAESAAAAAAAALFARFRLRLVDAQLTPFDIISIQRVDRLLSLSPVRHLDETEPLGPACHTVDHDTRRGNLTMCREKTSQVVVCR